jgi:phage-related protein
MLANILKSDLAIRKILDEIRRLTQFPEPAHREIGFTAKWLDDDLWVVHAFQKKSTQGIKTPRREIDLIEDRFKRLREALR